MSSNETKPLNDPWLLAVWPGIGNLAKSAANYLLRELEAESLGAMRDEDHFGAGVVRIRDGVIGANLKSRGRLYALRNTGGRDLLLFVGEEQPSVRGHVYCDRLLDIARRYGATRVMTFAALVTQQQPSQPSRVHSVASSRRLLEEVARKTGAPALADGELVGLNGTLLARAAQRGMDAVGLLAEVPALAANMPYLKASSSVLRAFRTLTGIDLDLDEVDRQAAAFERSLETLINHLKNLKAKRDGEEQEHHEPPTFEILPAEFEEEEPADEQRLEPGVVAQIEALFLRAQQDRRAAYDLKAKLDAHELFDRYEDRFLDLFSGASREARDAA